MKPLLPPVPTMRRAFAAKDPSFDGTFFVAIRSTGVFCRPVCRARPPRPENIEFFASAADALQHGYRPCQRCRPLGPAGAPLAGDGRAVVDQLLRLVEAEPAARLTGDDLRRLGIDASTARRQFRAHCGMSFAAYQRARRVARAAREMRDGRSAALAQAGAAYESGSAFRGAFARLFGAPPRDAAQVEVLASQWIPTPLGRMLAVASDDGLLLLDFADPQRLRESITRLTARSRAAGRPVAVVPGENCHLAAVAEQLGEYFAGRRRTFTVPVALRGTPFQRRAWDYLSTIPYGQTRTYGEQARAIDCPSAGRAVGRANGMNLVSILVPCHRVVGAAGDLTGYGGGVARKRWLLNHERAVLGRAGGAGPMGEARPATGSIRPARARATVID